jgi:hypothetical protein
MEEAGNKWTMDLGEQKAQKRDFREQKGTLADGGKLEDGKEDGNPRSDERENAGQYRYK